MSRREESVSVDEPKQKGFFRSARGRLATAGLATVLGLGGLGILSSQKTGDNNPSSPVPPGETITPDNSLEPTTTPAVTLGITPSPSGGSPFETTNPSPSPTETPVPAIEKVPVSETAKALGNLSMFPSDSAPGFWLQELHPQIIAKIRSGDSLLLATIIGNNKGRLQKITAGEFYYNGKLITLYNYKNLVIWYKLGPKTMLMVKNGIDANSGETEIGLGIDAIDKALSVGDDLYSINTSVAKTGNVIITNEQGKSNITTFGTIDKSVGEPISYDMKFVLDPSIVVKLYGTK